MALPNTKVEIAFNAGFTTPAASRTWTDVSDDVEGSQAITIVRGRQDEVSQIPPSQLSLTLNNKTGDYTPDRTGGAHYPNVKLGRPARVKCTYNAVEYTRYLGFSNGWEVGWPDGTDAEAVTYFGASSRTARLGRGAEVRSLLWEEIAAKSPAIHYPLNEPAGAVAAQDQSGNQHGPLVFAGEGAAVSFGASDVGPDSGAQFAGAGSGVPAGQYLAGPSGEASPLGFTLVLARDSNGGGTSEIVLAIAGGNPLSGIPSVRVSDSAITVVLAATTMLALTSAFSDGDAHIVELIESPASTVTLWVDGASVDSDTGSLSDFQGSFVLGGPSQTVGNVYTGKMAHFAAFDVAPTAADVALRYSALLGHAGDLSGDRIERYAGYGAIPTDSLAIDAGKATIGAVDTSGRTPIALMQEVNETENGNLYDAKDGTLTFKQRDARYNVASAFTLDATAQEVEADLNPKQDDQFIVNDVTATANGVPAGRVLDQTSADDNGYYRSDLATVTDDTADALAGANWRVGINKDPRARYSKVTVDITNSSTSQAAAVLGAEIGTRFTITGLPSDQAPSGTADLFVEGYTEVITATSHRITFNTSPTFGYAETGKGVWQLGVAGRSELGTTTRLAY